MHSVDLTNEKIENVQIILENFVHSSQSNFLIFINNSENGIILIELDKTTIQKNLLKSYLYLYNKKNLIQNIKLSRPFCLYTS